MQCPDCGSNVRDGARFCMECGAMLAAPVKITTPVMRSTGWEATDLHGAIARWRPTDYLGSAARIPRFFAWVIDCLLTGGFSVTLLALTGNLEKVRVETRLTESPVEYVDAWVLGLIGLIHAVYFIVFPATTWQATPGKRFLALRVTNMNGERIGLIQSAWRYLCQGFVLGIFIPIAMWASAMFGPAGPLPVVIALVFVLNANNKQSPWDMLAGTRVLE